MSPATGTVSLVALRVNSLSRLSSDPLRGGGTRRLGERGGFGIGAGALSHSFTCADVDRVSASAAVPALSPSRGWAPEPGGVSIQVSSLPLPGRGRCRDLHDMTMPDRPQGLHEVV